MPLIDPPIDHIDLYAQRLALLPVRHPRRLAMLLAQVGLVIAVACFCISIAGMNVGLLTALGGCLLAGAPLHRAVGVWALLLFMALLALSTLVHNDLKELFSAAAIPMGLLTAQVVFHPSMPGAARLRRLVAMAMVASVVISAVVALGQYTIGRGSNRPFRIDPEGQRLFRSSGFFSLHLTQGVIMGLMFFLLTQVTDGMGKVWRWVSVGASIVGVAICGARAALLGFVLALGASVAARGRRFLIIGGVAVVVLLSLVLGILRLTQPDRFDNLLAMKDGRWPIWQTTLQIISDHPWTGTGGSTGYRTAYRETYPQVVRDVPNEFPLGAPHAHNTPLAHAAEHGIPFALSWLVLLAVPLFHLWRSRAANPAIFRAVVGMGVMVLVFGQFEKLDGEASRVLWTGLGMLLALRGVQPHQEPEPKS